MKTIFILLVTILFGSIQIVAQNKKTKSTKPTVVLKTDKKIHLYDVDEVPEFIGGEVALNKYLVKNNAYTKLKTNVNDTTNVVIVRTVINPDGSNSDAELYLVSDEKYNQEALRLVKEMPKCKPAKDNNQVVYCYKDIAINFPATDKNKKELEEKIAMQKNNVVPEIKKETASEVSKVTKTNIAKNTDVVDAMIYENADEMPEFVGGEDALEAYIKNHNNIAKKMKPDDDITTIEVSVIIDEKGKATSPVFKDAVNKKQEAEAIRIIKTMPKWKPAKQNGHAVKCYTTLNFDFPTIIDADVIEPVELPNSKK